ncbi:MAG TPA: hypothetical protein VFK05_07150 [Polyangiaceae bacterium]|nr:hypothetical protein [Polyangiaceae bacterium]
MNEPTRLLEAPESELERALLDAGRSYRAPGSARAKTLLALGLTAVTTSTAPSAVAATSSLSKVTLSKLAIGVFALGAVAVPVWRYVGQHGGAPAPASAPAVTAAAPVVAPPAAASEPAPVQAPSPEPAASDSAAPEPAELRPAASGRSVSSMRAEPKPASAPPLSAELAALDAARTSLSHSDPAAALAALDGYSRDFPHGRLKLEAEVLRIGALSKSGQTELARKRAQTFLRLHPDSVLASRVRSYAGL